MLCKLWNVALVLATMAMSVTASPARADEPHDIGNRRELFVDRHLIDSLDNVRLVLHRPRPANVAIRFNDPWDGLFAGYVTVLRDNDRVRMFYRGWPGSDSGNKQVACVAESADGIRFSKPVLGQFEVADTRDNNVVWMHDELPAHCFTPFLDSRPGCPPDERYKAFDRGHGSFGRGLLPFVSADGLHWRMLSEKPVITQGAFDSQNLAFWDTNIGQYRAYFRIFTNRVRAVATCTSDDFVHWSAPQPVDLGDTELEHFYTNATSQYFRAPHYYLMFPKRFVPDRKRLPEHSQKGISDAVFLSSRDGVHFDREFREAFIRPGDDPLNWGDRSTMPAWGLVQTGPREMSIYYSQNYRYPTHHMRRGVLRLDGIASVQAGHESGAVVTKPLRFDGKQLKLNYSTSAAGSVRVEIQTAAGEPIEGFSLADAPPLYGDEIDEVYAWSGGGDVSRLAGQAVRLKFVLEDADLYAYCFE